MSDQTYILVSPNHTEITGTFETVTGRAGIVPFPKGEGLGAHEEAPSFDFDWEGGTDIFWDEQRTVLEDGERVFLDADGNQFKASTLRLLKWDDAHQCDNCEAIYEGDELKPVEDLHQRVDPGGKMPSGECPDPDCGALCYPVEG